MKEEKKREIAEKAFEEINNACKLTGKSIFDLPKDIQRLLIECYKLGFIRGLQELKGGE